MTPKEPKPLRPCAAALVRRALDGRFLLVRKPRVNHAWQFPQGGVEEGETHHAAALREFWEEIGTDKLMLDPEVQGIFRYRYPPHAVFPAHVVDKDRYGGQEVYIFAGEYLGAQADIRVHEEELCGYAWVTADEIPRYLQDKRYLAIVLSILSRVYGLYPVPPRAPRPAADRNRGNAKPGRTGRRGGRDRARGPRTSGQGARESRPAAGGDTEQLRG